MAAQERDASQRDAVAAALAAHDLLLVQGPPGTGKTRFIVYLIREALARNPAARILLASQTHVAIDNALERLAEAAPQTRILRIARSGSAVVADTCKGFLVEHQLDRWRKEVAESSVNWLRNWSRQNGLKPEEIEFGFVLKQIGGMRRRIEQLRSGILERDTRAQELRRSASELPHDPLRVELESVEAEIGERQAELDSDKKFLDQLEKKARQHKEADDYLRLSPQEMLEWS